MKPLLPWIRRLFRAARPPRPRPHYVAALEDRMLLTAHVVTSTGEHILGDTAAGEGHGFVRPLVRCVRRLSRRAPPVRPCPPSVEALEERALLASLLPQATADVNFAMGRMVADPVRDLVYVADQTDALILAVDTDLGRTVARQALAATPGALAVSPSGDRLFVAEPAASQVQVLSLPGLTPVTVLPVGFEVDNLVAAVNDHLFVSTPGTLGPSSIEEVDSQTGQVLGSLATQYLAPLLRTDPAGAQLYVREDDSGTGNDGSIDAYDVSGTGQPTLTGTYAAQGGQNSKDFLVDASAGRAYAMDGGVDGVGVTDLSTQTLSVWSFPGDAASGWAVAALPSGPAYGAAGTGGIFEFDANGTVQAQYPTPSSGVGPESLKITPNGHLLYGGVTGTNTSELGILGASSLTIDGGPTVYVVTTTKDIMGDTTPGELTLRDAITALDGTPSGNATKVGTASNVIQFDIPGVGPQTIDVGSDPSALHQPLPAIRNEVVIDGWSQGGSGYAGPPLVVLNGTNTGSLAAGLQLGAGSSGSTVRGLVVQQFAGSGIVLNGSNFNLITDNYVGTDAGGTAARGNTGDGVDLIGGSIGNTVGGTGAGAGNVLSGNGFQGLYLSDAGTSTNLIAGNLIGTDVSGTAPLGNGHTGVFINGTAANTIGGSAPGAGNVISANVAFDGVFLTAGASGNLVAGNRIGTDKSGTAALGNTDNGILVRAAANNTIGGTAAGAANVISGNGLNGVVIDTAGTSCNVVLGNFIGTDATGTAALGNKGDGVLLDSSAIANTIGGTTARAGNLLSGNGHSGVALTDGGTSANLVAGNFIGTDKSGTAALANGADGVDLLSGAHDNTIGGAVAGAGNVLSGNAFAGVYLSDAGTSGNLLAGNRIGTDKSGTAKLGNAATGVFVNGAAGNTVGGTAPGAGNVISASVGYDGVILTAGASGNLLAGNRVGTDVAGTAALGNSHSGILLDAAAGNTIGGTAAGSANVISGNGLNGVTLESSATSGNLVLGNLIGSDASGTAPLGNNSDGVLLGQGATANSVGGTATGAANLIADNAAGVEIDGHVNDNLVAGNRIGTDVTGTVALPNSFGLLLYGSGDTIDSTTAPALNTLEGNDVALALGPGADNNIIVGLRLGTNAAGTAALALPNRFGLGIGGAGNTIGGATYASANVLSGNSGAGLVLNTAGASGNVVLHNFIGTSAGGTAPLGNGQAGVELAQAAAGNTVGAGNVISGNGGVGVFLGDAATSGNVVQGNLVGTDVTGTNALGNVGDGVRIQGGATANTVGGTAAGSGNVISFNAKGVVVADNGSTGDSVLGNTILDNNGPGIDLGDDGPTANGTNPRAFPNHGQNTPVLTGLGPTQVSGSLNSAASTAFRLEFFAVTGSGASQRWSFLGSANVTTDATGAASFSAPVATIAAGSIVAGTATNLATGDTSEFSPGVQFTANVYVVTTTKDMLGDTAAGELTLRDALTAIDGTPSGNATSAGLADGIIEFAIPGAGPHTILVGSDPSALHQPLPAITNRVLFDGWSQGGSGYAGPPLIVLNGASAGTGASGLQVDAGGDGSTIRGLVIQQFSGDGLDVNGTSGNLIIGNYLGSDVNGTAPLGNTGDGILLRQGATANTVGGTAGGTRNLISGNSDGVEIHDAGTSANVVLGNFIGTDITGTASLGNQGGGVSASGQSSANTIGGVGAGSANIIAGNGGFGISVSGSAHGYVIVGNLIGTDATGIVALGNQGDGVFLGTTSWANTVGGSAAGAGNLISGNTGRGVAISGQNSTGNVVAGNLIGTDLHGTAALGNTRSGVSLDNDPRGTTIGGTAAGTGNVISGNGADGVRLSNDGVSVLSTLSSSGALVAGNFIGTDVHGTARLANAGSGVLMNDAAVANTIGAGNVISANTADGIVIASAGTSRNTVTGNRIGTDVTGTARLGNGLDGVLIAGGATSNTIGGNAIAFNAKGVVVKDGGTTGATVLGNSIFANAGPGIDLGDDGPTANGTNPRSFPNHGQNTPILTAYTRTSVTGTLHSVPQTTFRLELFVSPAGGQAYQGQTFLGSFNVTTSATGAASFTTTVPPIPLGSAVNATATNLTTGDTSELPRDGLLPPNLYVVTTTKDALNDTTPGELTLRDALTAVDGTPSGNATIAGLPNSVIEFVIPGAGPHTIMVGGDPTAPGKPLPALTRAVFLDGWSQGGFGYAGPPLIVLNGANAAASANGLELDAGSSGSKVRGLVIQQFGGSGIALNTTRGNMLLGDYVGTDANGTAALGNGIGVYLSGAAGNTIGGTVTGAANVISGNGTSAGSPGLEFFGAGASGNVVLGNRIGTAVGGTAAVGNRYDGIVLQGGASANTIGGMTTLARNVISGNGRSGVVLTNGGASANLVAGNFIGTDVRGTAALANGADGVDIVGGASRNTIGGTAAGAGNVLSGNAVQGVYLSGAASSGNRVAGNLIGTDANGTARLGNLGTGVYVNGAAANTIGGAAAGAANVISANSGYDGVVLTAGASGNLVIGDRIGTDRSGTGALGNTNNGVYILNAARNTIGGTAAGAGNVLSGNGANGVDISGSSSGNVVLSNLIGTAADGRAKLGNNSDGVLLSAGTTANTVGGTTTAAANVIAANFAGVEIAGHVKDNTVLGNQIGTNARGTAALPNTFGMLLDGSGDTINATTAPGRNTLEGNSTALGLAPGANNNTVVGLRLGTNAAGTAVLPLPNAIGLVVEGAGNTIGGATYASANVLSGNRTAGLVLQLQTATGNIVRFNYIGTSAGGTAGLGNSYAGVEVVNLAAGNTVGAGNVISANGTAGVVISGAGTSGNVVVGSLIGSDVHGTARLGNRSAGVLLNLAATQNTVGGTAAGSGNTVAFNPRGVVLTDNGTTGNTVLGNSIWGNTGPGIDLGGDGPTPNDANPRSFPNNGQNTPVITGLTLKSVSGSLTSAPNTPFRLEFFADPVGGTAGQGKSFLGFLNVTTNATGAVNFTAPVATIPVGMVVTATASNLSTGDTSEFSPVGAQMLVLSTPTLSYNVRAQVATLTAQLFHETLSGYVALSGQKVTFTITGLPGAVTGTVGSNGQVTAQFSVPAQALRGQYIIVAAFAGIPGISAVTGDSTLTIA
jgi:hypothetical protein